MSRPTYPGRVTATVAAGAFLILVGIVIGGPIGGVIILVGAVMAGIALGARYQRM